MTQLQWTIDGRRFHNLEEFEAAKRDKQLIETIIGNRSLGRTEDIEAIYHELKLGKYQFESIVGRQFDDNIYELYSRILQERKEKEASKVKKQQQRMQKLQRLNPVHKEDITRKEKEISIHDYDPNMQKQILLELKKREKKRKRIITACILLCVVSFSYLGFYYQAAAKSKQDFDDLIALKLQSAAENMTQQNPVIHRVNQDNQVIPDILPDYQLLYEKNPQIVGWIKIGDTIIDYPVMQTTDNEFYLNHNFDGEEDRNGCIFMDYQCNILKGDDNTILYGHHMKSGQMFGTLNKYSDKSYFDKHPTIEFDTIYEKGEYQIVYVFRSKVYSEEEVTFKYYQFINATSVQEFNSYMNEMSQLSIYDTGITTTYGDSLLTLSTCDYQETKGRFVIVAKRIK